MEKTLYISDLDGTLLNSNGKVSSYTANVINKLIDDGMIFSYATARSIVTSAKITENLNLNVPVVVHNGIFITENNTHKIISGNFLNKKDSEYILKTLNQNKIYPFAHTILNGEERISYCAKYLTDGMKNFLNVRKGDRRLNEVLLHNVGCGDVFHYTCIDENEKLIKMNELFKNDFQCIYYEDIYSHQMWLEILPKNVTKGNTILKLKSIIGCDKIVCFGDGTNDIPMFEIADECYATANADDELKQIATDVIESNDDDGVARFLKKMS